MFVRTELWRRMKSCRQLKEKKGNKQEFKSLLPARESSDGLLNILHSMLQDHVTSHIIYIIYHIIYCHYGVALYAKKGREQIHRTEAPRTRKICAGCKGSQQAGERSSRHVWSCTIEAARRVSDYNASTSEEGKPSTAVKNAFSLKGATEAWIGPRLSMSDVLTEKRAKKFKELLDNSWSTYVSTNARSTVEQRRRRAFNCGCGYSAQRAQEDWGPGEHVSTTAYKMLSQSLLARIMVLDKKCEGEASRFIPKSRHRPGEQGHVWNFISGGETTDPQADTVSDKRGRKVPILLLQCTKASLDFLLEIRREVGVLEENPSLFARLGTTSNLRLRKYTEESRAPNPEPLWSTKRRKHVATFCQRLELDNQEVEQVARLMGHDIRVHCEYNQIFTRRSANCCSPWIMEQSRWRHWTLWNWILTH